MGVPNLFLSQAPSNLVATLHNAHHDCPAKMAKFAYKNTCPSVENYQSQNILKQNAVGCRSHLAIENNLKVEKRIFFRKLSSTTSLPEKKSLGYA